MLCMVCADGISIAFTVLSDDLDKGLDVGLDDVLALFALVFEPAREARKAAARTGRALLAARRADFAGFFPVARVLLTFFAPLALFFAVRAGILLDGRAAFADCVPMLAI
ncbi:MAG TPA: hypothetical protein VFC54_13905 [Pseudolabrys sp.]|nr:hypothetical protein [Pseudolabrys sp.]